jgi:copper chaperone CopZ
VFSSKFKVLALSVLILGAATYAFACGDNKNKSASAGSCGSKATTASAVVASKEACPVSKDCPVDKCPIGSKASATVASATDGCCAAKGASATVAGANGCASQSSAKMAAAGDHCGAKGVAAGECNYGENTVTMAGTACPAANEAHYAFMVKDAECQGTGTAVAKAVKSVKGVSAVTVDYSKHMVYVCTDSKAAGQKDIEKSLKAAGYKDIKVVSGANPNCAKSHGKVEA